MMQMLTRKLTSEAAVRLSKTKTYGLFIDGKWIAGDSGETIALENPATRQVIAHIQAGNAVDVGLAVDAAARAFPSWSQTPAGRRQEILLAIAQRMRERSFDYAMLESLNNGKTINDAFYADVPQAINLFEYYAGAAFHLKGEVLDFADATVMVHREPIGVVAQIIPWNVPLLMAALKLAPALAAGCTVVLKPAETVCASVLEFIADIADLLPHGVVNVVTGYGPIVGEPLVTHPKVRKVAFTGSRPTAQKIVAYAAKNIIPQTLELGGKSANIVCEDADIEAAAQSAVISTVFNKGEVCLAGSRVFVHKNIEEGFTDSFQRQLAAVRQGDPIDPTTQMGAMASRLQFDKVQGYLDLGRKEGARVVLGGAPSRIRGLENGFFIQPTIFSDGPQRDADRTGGNFRTGHQHYPLVRRIGNATTGQRLRVWTGWRNLDEGSGARASLGARPGNRRNLDQPVLQHKARPGGRRLQAERLRPRRFLRNTLSLHAHKRRGDQPRRGFASSEWARARSWALGAG
jgi:aldehyde dehydrogenase